MVIPPRHGRICKSANGELNLACLGTRVDLEDRLSLFDPSNEAYNSLIPLECSRFAFHKVLVGACSLSTFIVSLGAFTFYYLPIVCVTSISMCG